MTSRYVRQLIPCDPTTSGVTLFFEIPKHFLLCSDCLAAQTSKNYELIVVDDILDARKEHVQNLASQLGVNLQYLVNANIH
jgi:hypothetical protein